MYMLGKDIRAVLDRIKLGRGRRLEVQDTTTFATPIRFRITYIEADADNYANFPWDENPVVEAQYGRWWYIERDMSEEAIIKTAWLALTVSDEHARREWFRVDGVQIFSPHNRILNNDEQQRKESEEEPTEVRGMY